jgi:cysteine synthase A
MSLERRMMLLSLGAEVVLTPKETAVPGALAKAHEILAELGDKGYMLQQFENPANPRAHRETTGPEIWRDTDGTIDIFVSGVGTGGTVTGVSQYIKGSSEFNCPPLNSNLYTVAVEPQEQMLLTEAKGGVKIGEQGPHKIQGVSETQMDVLFGIVDTYSFASSFARWALVWFPKYWISVWSTRSYLVRRSKPWP